MIKRVCGHPDCSVSHNYAGTFTFGRGKLGFGGDWEFPCHLCAREHEKETGEVCWPFAFERNQEEIERDVEDMVGDIHKNLNQTLALVSDIMDEVKSMDTHSYSFVGLESIKLCILDARDYLNSIKKSK